MRHQLMADVVHEAVVEGHVGVAAGHLGRLEEHPVVSMTVALWTAA